MNTANTGNAANTALNSIRLSAGLLAVVIAAGVVALGVVDPPTLLVGAVFLILVVVSRFSGLYRYADVVALLLGSSAYAILERERGGDGAAAWAVATGVFASAAVAVRLIESRIGAAERRIRQLRDVTRDLTMYDAASALLKARYGEPAIAEEVDRARRTQTSLTLVLISADPKADQALDAGRDVEEEAGLLGPFIGCGLRSIDRGIRLEPALFGALLPATAATGGTTVAHKLCRDGAQQVGRSLRCAVATFPDHAVSAEELLGEARAALRLAQAADLPVVTPSMLAVSG